MQFVPGPAQLVRTRLAVHAYVRAVSLAFPFSRAREGRRRIKNQDAAGAGTMRLRTVEESRVNSVPAGFTWAK